MKPDPLADGKEQIMKRLENRIARLETANRRYLVLLLLLGFVFVARVGMAGADESVPEVIRAKSFEVVGDKDQVFIRLYRAGPNSYVDMKGKQGSSVITLMAGAWGSIVTRDSDGHYLVMTGKETDGGGFVNVGGPKKGEGVAVRLVGRRHGGRVDLMSTEHGSVAMVLRADDQGAGQISILDRNMKGQLLTPHP
jgi:hypothetical protein